MEIEVFWDILSLSIAGTRYLLILRIDFDIVHINYTIRVLYINLELLAHRCGAWIWCTIAIERLCLVIWPTNLLVRRASYKEALIINLVFVLITIVMNGNIYVETSISRVILFWVCLLPGIVMPFMVMILTSLITLHRLNPNINKISPLVNPQTQSHLNALKLILSVSIYFFVSHTPFFVFNIIAYIK